MRQSCAGGSGAVGGGREIERDHGTSWTSRLPGTDGNKTAALIEGLCLRMNKFAANAAASLEARTRVGPMRQTSRSVLAPIPEQLDRGFASMPHSRA